MPAIDALNGPRLLPRGNADAAVVLLHGYGSDGDDLIGLAPYFAQALPNTAFYAPHGPSATEMGFGGYQWFSLRGFDPEQVRDDPQARARALGMAEGVDVAVARINSYLDQVLAQHDLQANRLALLGFSQGTMMSLHVGLRRKEQLAGIVGYSGALLAADRLAGEIATRPPVLLIHGDADPVVPVVSTREATEMLTALKVPCESHVIPGLQHGIDDEGIALGLQFLRDKLG